MDLQESTSASWEGLQVFKNDVDSPFYEAEESCNIYIKDEPFDITEFSQMDFKKELEDFSVDIKEEPCLEENSNSASNSIETNASNIISMAGNKLPVITKLIIKGQEKTCILVRNPAMKDTIMESIQKAQRITQNAPNPNEEFFNKIVRKSMVTNPDKSSLIDHTYSLSKDKEGSIVTGSRCFSVVRIDNFRKHINTRFPRKTVPDKVSCDEVNEHKKTSSHQTIRAVYNLFTGEAVALTDISFPSYNEQRQKNDGEKKLFHAESCDKTKKVRRYDCDQCSYVTRDTVSLNVHKMGHTRKKPVIQCNKCSFRSTRRALTMHKREHIFADPSEENSLLLEDNTFSCSLCSFTTNTQQILRDHERDHRLTSLPIVKCFYCDQRYTRYMLYIHIMDFHPGQKFKFHNEQYLESSINSLSTTEENNVEEHVSESTEKSLDFKATQNCSLCSFSTSDQVTLGVHLKKHQFEPIERATKRGRLKYDCRMCSYGYHNISGMMKHINSHKKNLPIRKCPECDFRSTDHALMCHMRKCTLKSTENCEEGRKKVGTNQNSKFSESDKLWSEKSFKCAFCSFSTQNKLKLVLHVKEKHLIKGKDSLGRIFYRCELCSFSSRGFTSIINHMNWHKSNVPTVKCPNCDFKSIPKALISHWTNCKSKKKVQIEDNRLFEPIRDTDSSGRQRIRCNMCSYASNQMKTVLRHIESHKRNLPIISCSYCDFRSTVMAVEYHQKKCKSASNVDAEKAAKKSSVNYFEHKEVSSNSLNTSGNKIVADQNAVSNRNKLQLHMKKKRRQKFVKRRDSLGRLSYHCKLCSYSSKKCISIMSHMNWHESNIPILKCRNCNFKAIRRVMICHARKCGSKTKVQEKKRLFEPLRDADSSGRQKFYCKMCSYSSSQIEVVLRHIESHKRNLPMVTCSFCDFKSTLIPMRYHLKKCKSANVKPEKVAIKSEKTNSDLRESTETNLNTLDPEHTKNVSDETIMDQNSVQSSGSNKDLFIPKICVDSSGTKFQCKICTFSSCKLENAAVHVNIHKKKMPIINCFNNCGFKSTRNAVVHHFKTCRVSSDRVDIGNTNEAGSVFTCPICTYSTSLRIKLKLHMKKRHFKKMFSCAYCSFFTEYKWKHTRHVKSHVRKLPFKKCPYCSFESVSDIIKKHVRYCIHKRKAPVKIKETRETK